MRVLYLGLTPPPSTEDREIIHLPVIRIVPVPVESTIIAQAFANLSLYTHVIFTSKSAVSLLCKALEAHGHSTRQLQDHRIIAVGQATASIAEQYGLPVSAIASPETAEGVAMLLQKEALKTAHVFWPRAGRTRSILHDFLCKTPARFTDCVFYHTELVKPVVLPNLSEFDEIVFTSPSTVDGFLALYGALPQDTRLISQGPITAAALEHWNK